jgi:hypothetical protein
MDANPARHTDSRDSRTQEGPSPRPVEEPDSPSERLVEAPPDDPVNAVNPMARPSSYTDKEIEEGDTPLDEEMDRMVDPDIGREALSNNPDVLNLDASWRVESEEPDFTEDPGTTDIIMAVEEGEPYFPPTDPPLRPSRLQNADIMGGFASTSLEEPLEPEDEPLRLSGDEEMAEQVRYALAADAYTADLNIEVEVEDGVVYLHGKVGSLEDIEQAEQVAGSVAGVEEVQEDLEIV